MSVFLVDCYEKGKKGERSIQLVKRMIDSVFEECGTLVTGCRIKVIVRRLHELSDLLCTWELGDIVSDRTKSCAVSFDKVNFFFIAGDLGTLLPWDPALAPLVTLCHMANVVKKPVFCIGLGAFAGVYSAATLGDKFYVFNNVDTRDEPSLGALQRYPIVYAKSVPSPDSAMSSAPKYQGGWLDSQTGDIYTYNISKRIWSPEVNVGVHKTPTFGQKEVKPGVMHFKMDDALLSRSIPLESANRRQEVCGIRSKHTQHYAVRDFKQNTFILTPQPTWSINGDAALPIAHHLVALADGVHGPVLLSQGNMLLVNCEVHEDNSYHVLKQIMRNYVSHILNGLFSGSHAVKVRSMFTYLFGADGEGGHCDPWNLVKQRGPCAATQSIPSVVPEESLMMVRLELRLRNGTSLPISISPSSSSLTNYANGELRLFTEDGDVDYNVLLSARPHTSLGKPVRTIVRRPTTSQHTILRGFMQRQTQFMVSSPENRAHEEEEKDKFGVGIDPERHQESPIETMEYRRRQSIEKDAKLAEFLAKIEAAESANSPNQFTAKNSPPRTDKSSISGSPADSWAQPTLLDPNDKRIQLRRFESNDTNSEGELGEDELVQLFHISNNANSNNHTATGGAGGTGSGRTSSASKLSHAAVKKETESAREAREVAGLPSFPAIAAKSSSHTAEAPTSTSANARTSSHVHAMMSLSSKHPAAAANDAPAIKVSTDPDNKGFGVPANKKRAASAGGPRRSSDASFSLEARRMLERGSEDPSSAMPSSRTGASKDPRNGILLLNGAARRLSSGGGAPALMTKNHIEELPEDKERDENAISNVAAAASGEQRRGSNGEVVVLTAAHGGVSSSANAAQHYRGGNRRESTGTGIDIAPGIPSRRGSIQDDGGGAGAATAGVKAQSRRGSAQAPPTQQNTGAVAKNDTQQEARSKSRAGDGQSLPSYGTTSVSSDEESDEEEKSHAEEERIKGATKMITSSTTAAAVQKAGEFLPPKPQKNVAIPGWDKVTGGGAEQHHPWHHQHQQHPGGGSRRQSREKLLHLEQQLRHSGITSGGIVRGGSSSNNRSGNQSNAESRKNSGRGQPPSGPSGYPPLIDIGNKAHSHSLSKQMMQHLLPRSHPNSCPNSARGGGAVPPSSRPKGVTFVEDIGGGGGGGGGKEFTIESKTAESGGIVPAAAAAGRGDKPNLSRMDWSVYNIQPVPSLPDDLKRKPDIERSDTSIGIEAATKSELLATLHGDTAHWASKLELERTRYESAARAPIVEPTVVQGAVAKPFNNLKKFEDIAREQKIEDEKEYKGVYIGGVRSAFEREMAENKEAKKKFIAGPFLNCSGKASAMPLRPPGGIRTEGTYPQNPGFVTSRRAKLYDKEIIRKEEKSRNIAKAWA